MKLSKFLLLSILAIFAPLSSHANTSAKAGSPEKTQAVQTPNKAPKDLWSGHPRNAKEKERVPHDVHIASLENKDSFTFILYGDPQSYNRISFRPIFKLMTSWTLLNKEHLNIKAVLCTGDLVETNDDHVIKRRDAWKGDISAKEHWEAASAAFGVFDNELPYILALGNHDYGYISAESRNTKFSDYFYPERNSEFRKVLVSTGKNYFDKMTLENAAYEFSDKNWGKILVLVMEFGPSDRSIKWAKKVLHSDNFKNHKVILLTHAFLDGEGKITPRDPYRMPDSNGADTLWKELIKDAPNVKMVISGHRGNFCSYRLEKNNAGKSVHMMMFNPQFRAGNGGDGWLRIMEFMPDGKTVGMRTFSPLFAVSPNTADRAWRKGAKYEYKIVFDN